MILSTPWLAMLGTAVFAGWSPPVADDPSDAPDPDVSQATTPPSQDASASDEDVSPETTTPQQRAASLFSEGEEAFVEGDYATAAQAFAEAESIAPHPDTRFNLGVALAHGGRLLEAWEVFQTLVDDPEATSHDDARRESKRLEQRLSFVTVLSPTGLVVCFDGQRIDEQPVVTLPGPHRLRAPNVTQRLNLRPGQTYTLDLRYFETKAPAPAPIAPWLGMSIGASATSLGLGVAAARVQDETTRTGLAIGAASIAGIALASSVVALVVHRKEPTPPPPSTLPPPC